MTKYVRMGEGVREIDPRPVCILSKRKKFTDMMFTVMFPITEKIHLEIREGMEDENTAVIDLKDMITVGRRSIKIFGDTDDIPDDVAREINIESTWGYVFQDREKMLIHTYDKNPQVTEYSDPVEIVKYGIGRLGNPNKIAVLEISEDRYFMSNYYLKVIKPHYGI